MWKSALLARSLKAKVNLNEGSGGKDGTDKGDCQARVAAPVKGRVEVVLAHLAEDKKENGEEKVCSPECRRVGAHRSLGLPEAPLLVLPKSSR